MKHETMKWWTNDRQELFAQKWEPEGEIKGVISLVHGMGEHSGRYVHWAERLAGAGYALVAIDLRGHGQSGGQRGDTPSYDHLADDVEILIRESKAAYPGRPCFLYGHSLGGVIALFSLVQRQSELKGVVITSPALRTAIEDQKIKVVLAKVLGSIIPKSSLPTDLEQAALSRDPSVIEDYRNDPLVHDQISFRMGKDTLKAVNYIYANADQIKIPILLMQGSDDRIAYAAGPEKLSSLASGDCTYKLYEGFFHELHNEPEKDEVFAYLRNWLDSKL